MGKYTKGPWIVNAGSLTTVQSLTKTNCVIAVCYQKFPANRNLPPKEEANANAQLISAAPDLLEEHKNWAKLFGNCIMSYLQGDIHDLNQITSRIDFEFDTDGSPILKSEAISKALGKG